MRPQTLTQKIYTRTAGRRHVEVGEELVVRPDRIMTQQWPGYLESFIGHLKDRHGTDAVLDPDRYVVFIDHLVTRGDRDEDEQRAASVEWAKRTGVHIHDRIGIGHQVAAEMGYAVPGALVVHQDPHISGIGAFGSLGLGLFRRLLEPWTTGELVTTVPGSVRIELVGALPANVDGRDVLHHLIHRHGPDGFLGQVLEIGGPGLSSMTLADRQSLCGMVVFTGAESAVMDQDETALDFVEPLARTPVEAVTGDPHAEFIDRIEVDLGQVSPMVALPGSSVAEHIVPIGDAVGTPVQRGYIGSCSSGRYEDLEAAAKILAGRRVAPGFGLVVVPTSEAIRARAERSGLVALLSAAGATVAGSSCDHCYGYAGPLLDDQTCISSGVLNVRGRMGSTRSEIYLGSAQTVAASALAGVLSDPRDPGLLA